MSDEAWTEDALSSLARDACEGTPWRFAGVARDLDGWGVRFKHERGDYGFVRFDDGVPADERGAQAVFGWMRGAVLDGVPWPHFKRGDPIPQFVAPASRDDLPSLRPGMRFECVAIDLDAETVTLIPSDGPWNLPEFRSS